ncbi:MAG: porin family protein [Chitinophagaceae bacterium]
MKTKLLMLIAFLVLAQLSRAQFHLGVKAGANISKIEGRSFKDEFKYGYLLGGFAEIGLGGRLGLQPEVLFNQYQTRVDSNFKSIYQNAFSSATNRDVKLNYLSIPLLLNYKLGSLISLQAGPQFGILLNQDKDLLENGQEAFKSGEFSLLGGVQFKFSKLRLSGRYAVGLNNLNDIDDKDKWNSQAIQVSLGLAL